MPSLKARIGLCLSGICTLETILDDVGCLGGLDLVVLSQLDQVDYLVQWQVVSGLNVNLGDVGHPGGPDLDVPGQLIHVDHPVHGQVAGD